MIKRKLQYILGKSPIYMTYVAYRFMGYWGRYYRKLLRTQWYRKEEIVQYQSKALKNILLHVCQEIPFYKNLYKKNNINIQAINSLDDLSNLPMISRNDLKTHWNDFVSENYQDKGSIKTKTSGSSGEPVEILIDSKTNSLVESLIGRSYHWAGLDFSSKTVYIGTPFGYEQGTINSDQLYEFDATQKILKINSALIHETNFERIFRVLEEYAPDHINIYPSYIDLLCQYLKKNPRFCIRPKAVTTRGEKIHAYHRQLVQETFGCECYEIYGLFEYVVFATECEHHRLHLNFELGITEILKNGIRCVPGEVGELVCTGLQNHAMPLIRYRTGDFGKFIEGTCPCGREMPMIEIVASRGKDLVITSKGYFSVKSGLPLFFEGHKKIRQIQFYQGDKESLEIKIVPNAKFEKNEINQIIKVVDEYFLGSLKISVRFVDSIPREASGKYKYVESKVSVEI